MEADGLFLTSRPLTKSVVLPLRKPCQVMRPKSDLVEKYFKMLMSEDFTSGKSLLCSLGFILETTSFRMQTPQGARTELLVDAHRKALSEGFVGTDEVELLQRLGVEVRVVVGDARNIKLTRPSDWAMAKALWSTWAEENR